MKPNRFEEYLIEIEQLKQATREVYTSLEVDYIPGVISPDNFKHLLDYTIGSIHFVEGYEDGRLWEIDGASATFADGLEHIFRNDIREAVVRYYELTREMIVTSTPTVLGHLDKIKIQNTYRPYFNESDPWYRDEIQKTVAVIKSAGTVVEVNTRGLYQKKSTTPYPSPWVLDLLRKERIPVLLSSDAHHPDDLFRGFEETATLLLQLGFTMLTTLQQGSWVQLPFDQTGILRDRR
jgi:histidinol-phosphatase (PHP family)